MSEPEIVPIRTNDVVLFELRPGGQWVAVRAPHPTRITVGLRTLDVFKVREVRAVEGDEARIDRVLSEAVASVQCGADVLTIAAVPFVYLASLSALAFTRSVTGADPFFVAPAGSQP